MKMKELFGDDLRSAEGGGELTFEDYLKAIDPTYDPAEHAPKV